MKISKKVRDLLRLKPHVNINLGCGENIMPGFINIDIRPYPGVDLIMDVEKYPWKLPSDSVDLVVVSQLVEHINPHKGGFIKFMDEAWRVLKLKGKIMISTPYGSSEAYIQDPTHCNPCNEITWAYFDPMDGVSKGRLYEVYRPKPWRIVNTAWYTDGNIEVVMEKRRDDEVYHPPKGFYEKEEK
jgi:SAM-dependent methyltransferase